MLSLSCLQERLQEVLPRVHGIHTSNRRHLDGVIAHVPVSSAPDPGERPWHTTGHWGRWEGDDLDLFLWECWTPPAYRLNERLHPSSSAAVAALPRPPPTLTSSLLPPRAPISRMSPAKPQTITYVNRSAAFKERVCTKMNKKENLFRVKRKPTIVVKMQTTAPDRSSLHWTLKRRGYFSSPEKKTCEIFVIIMVHTICCGCCRKRAFVVDCKLFMVVSVFVRICWHLCMSSVKGSKVIILIAQNPGNTWVTWWRM